MLPSFLALALALALAPGAERPRLALLVSVGPLPLELVERLRPRLAGGLARCLDAGLVLPEAELDYALTEDAPGLATLGTGAPPRVHGIPSERFLDRERLETRAAVADPAVRTLAPGGVFTEATPGGCSPGNLRTDGAADRLRAAIPGARAASIGGDAQGAVLLAGRHPDWAFWWDERAGGFTSSSWYGEALPDWVLAWNAGWRERANGFAWKPLGADATDPAFAYAFPQLAGSPAPIEVQALAQSVATSPMVDRFAVELALEAQRALELGADEAPDLLCVALSGFDAIAHRFGPDSAQAADVALRLDGELGRLFDALDERVGKGAWIAAVAGTSGMLELPEHLRERGVGARRVFSDETRRDLGRVRERLRSSSGTFFGATLVSPFFFFDPNELARSGADAAEARHTARGALLEERNWIAGAYTLEELAGAEGDAQDPWLALYRRSFPADRAPDLVIRPQPWSVVDLRAGSDHGTLYPYDRRILLAFVGAGVAHGRNYERASAEDVLPTLLAGLGIAPAEGMLGRALELSTDAR